MGRSVKNRIFSFTSFEQWDDNKPVTVVRTLPTELERRGDFSQSVYSGRIRTIYDPWSSTLNSAGRVIRTPFTGNIIPGGRLDPVAAKLLAQLPLPNLPGNVDNWQGTVNEKVDYWNFSQRVDVNLTDNLKVFARYGQFKANVYQQNPTQGKMFPVSGSNRYGMSAAGDAVWVMSNRTTLNVRGSYYNMTDEYANPEVILGEDGLEGLWPGNPWYSSLYVSPYVYYPARHRDRRQPDRQRSRGARGRERVVPAAEGLDRLGADEPVPGSPQPEVGRRASVLPRRGRALRADQPAVPVGSDGQQLRQPRHRRHREPVGDLHARRARQQQQRRAGPAPESRPEELLGVLPGRFPREATASR